MIAEFSDIEAHPCAFDVSTLFNPVIPQWFLDVLGDAVLILDHDGLILMANRNASNLFGLTPARLIGSDITALIAASDRIGFERACYAALESNTRDPGTAVEHYCRGLRNDGEELALALSVRAYRRASREFLVLVRDVTIRQAHERNTCQLLKMEALNRLTGRIAHEFNNLLAVLNANVELAHDASELETVRRYLVRALQAGERGAALIRRLVGFSRQIAVEATPTDPDDVITQVVAMARAAFPRNIAINHLAAPCALSLRTNRTALSHVLFHLCMNARDAMQNGGCLAISCEAVELRHPIAELCTGRYVAISISDDGAGMSENVLAHALDPFFTTKDAGDGAGLGLTLAYSFVRQFDGMIELHSRLGLGTTVRILLPCGDTNPATAM